VDGEIVPNTKNWNNTLPSSPIYKLGSITDAIYSSGFVALDLSYTLGRTDYTLDQISSLQTMVSNCQVHMGRLFAMKQALLGSDTPFRGIKVHMLSHFVDAIVYWGCPKVFDMIR
jgi:hypothetical protein